MAVLRASRLYATTIFPSARDLPQPRAETEVYVVPAGYRAIVRTMVTVLNQIPPTGTDPYFQVILFLAAGGGLNVRWHQWLETTGTTSRWRPEDTWNGQLVLEAGDRLTVFNSAPIAIQQSAHGHLLPIA